MTTAAQIVDGAAEEIGVKTAEIALEPEDAQIIFTRMNDMLSEWADSGITPGFKEVFDLTDTVDIDRNAVAAVKYNLAIRCAPAFKKTVSSALAAISGSTLDRLMASNSFIDVQFPDTLPVGSGNSQCDDNDNFFNNRFFPTNKKENF